MISHLRGRIIRKESGQVLIETSGVGYKVFVSSNSYSVLSKAPDVDVSLWTHLSVRETAMDLYGFVDREELVLFELLVGISGIGPKSALAILSLTTVDALRKSISSENITYLTKVSGIGKKSAEKIILELKDKLGDSKDNLPDLKEESDVVEALRSLGYSLKESREVLKKVDRKTTGTGERVKAALKILGG